MREMGQHLGVGMARVHDLRPACLFYTPAAALRGMLSSGAEDGRQSNQWLTHTDNPAIPSECEARPKGGGGRLRTLPRPPLDQADGAVLVNRVPVLD